MLHATQTINDLTGYTAIEAIKARNSQLETALATAQERLRAARHAYKDLTSHRATTQREVTTLLARKDTWGPHDVERFTTLYRTDHELESRVAGAAAELTEAEADESRLSAELNAGILRRYHEEQIWSDRIRRQSTWGTWGLMGVNILLFLVLQFVAEPWRRRRMIKGIAESEKGAMDEFRRELGEVRAALEVSTQREQARSQAEAYAQAQTEAHVQAQTEAEAEADAGVEAAQAADQQQEQEQQSQQQTHATAEAKPIPEPIFPRRPWREVIASPALFKAIVRDLYSERRIDVRMRDVTIIALEGAAAGAAVVASVAFFALRRP